MSSSSEMGEKDKSNFNLKGSSLDSLPRPAHLSNRLLLASDYSEKHCQSSTSERQSLSSLLSSFNSNLSTSTLALSTHPHKFIGTRKEISWTSYRSWTRVEEERVTLYHSIAMIPSPSNSFQPSDPTYGFPFEPYDIQQQLMDHLYQSLAQGKCTVIESPTGTVRSLFFLLSLLSLL